MPQIILYFLSTVLIFSCNIKGIPLTVSICNYHALYNSVFKCWVGFYPCYEELKAAVLCTV